MLYIISPSFMYFIIGIWYLLTPSSILHHPIPPPPPLHHQPALRSGNHQSVTTHHVFSFYENMFFLLDSTYKWDHMVFVFFCLTHFTSCNALQVHTHQWQGKDHAGMGWRGLGGVENTVSKARPPSHCLFPWGFRVFLQIFAWLSDLVSHSFTWSWPLLKGDFLRPFLIPLRQGTPTSGI